MKAHGLGSAALMWLSLHGCLSGRPAGTCATSSDCKSGHLCVARACVPVCDVDEQCASGQICVDGACAPGAPRTPEVTAVDGDDPERLCPDAGGGHCIATGITVTGGRLLDATFYLLSDAGRVLALAPAADRTDTRARLPLAPDTEPGTYTLFAANTYGSAALTVSLLQGPPGPALTPDQLVDAVNSASRLIAVERLPVGTVHDSVAAGDHAHEAADTTAGTFAIARLPVGTSAQSVAAGDHVHGATEVVAGVFGLDRLPMGTTAGTVAAGNHLHQATDVTAGTILPERLPIGASAGMVAAGDHKHSTTDVAGLEAYVMPMPQSIAAPWVSGITYDPVTNALFYIQSATFSVGRYDLATGRDTLVWYNSGSNAGEGVAVVTRPLTGARELWFGYSGWGYIRHVPVTATPADATTPGAATDYPFAPGGFVGLVPATPLSGVPDSYLAVRSDTSDVRYWVFGASDWAALQLASPAGGETTNMNTAAVNTVLDGRAGGIVPAGLYLDTTTRTVWVGDLYNGYVWIYRYDPAELSAGAPNLPLLRYVARIRPPLGSNQGLAYDRARKLIWTCSYGQYQCVSAHFDIDVLVASLP